MKKKEVLVCGFCLRSLETVQQQAKRLIPNWNAPLPFLQECTPTYQAGCLVEYCSPKCRARHWDQSHAHLCEAVGESLSLSENLSWEGCVPIMDHALLVEQLVAHQQGCQQCRAKPKDDSAWPGWCCFQVYCWVSWETIPFGCPSHMSPEQYAQHKKAFLREYCELLNRKYPDVREGIVSRLFGLISLNCQERTPIPPFVAYLENLKSVPYDQTKDFLAVCRLEEAREKALEEAKGEGLFLLHSAMNHSCAPNAIVTNSYEDRDCHVVVEALVPIEKGEELSISYIDETMDVKSRQSILREHYAFACACPKCSQEHKVIST